MKPRVISGKVSLPDGVAPSGGISLNMRYLMKTDGNSADYYNTGWKIFGNLFHKRASE